ncbi:MAG: glycoside hydrolase family 57 [Deltaproteobacteria bacterium]|nr:glycoside hydrolase family 57 [Deltaproteobacteria bacterium]
MVDGWPQVVIQQGKLEPLHLYTVFHLNLAYSSIEEDQRPEVIRNCYWPLLHLAKELGFPFGIEAAASTLETVAVIDPSWIGELKRLINEGPCEFVGSGYSQIIGPLVPAEVNTANLRIGNRVYRDLLGMQPGVALVNEQAYSAGMIQHYLDNGYQGIVMEWDNPSRFHPEWNPEWRYLPQIARGRRGEEIPLLWNKSIAFQKFQRYAHGEMEIDEYLEYLVSHLSGDARAMSLYGNDVEIFDFRPGRFHTEAPIEFNEWERIRLLFKTLMADDRFQSVSPWSVLEWMDHSGAGNRLSLESPESPVPVKKQGKYNITRWAVTGRDDLGVNTICWRIYEILKSSQQASEEDWKELCYLWSSDFRTHISEKRWKDFKTRLSDMETWVCGAGSASGMSKKKPTAPLPTAVHKGKTRRERNYLFVETDDIYLQLNCRRGLAFETLRFTGYGETSLCGTLPHGYFDDIGWGADFYSGHLVLESPGRPKVTDLNPVEPEVLRRDSSIIIRGSVQTELGPVHKEIIVNRGVPRVELNYCLDWSARPVGSLRLGHVALNPEVFDYESLFYSTHNGGKLEERFDLYGVDVDHGLPVSFLVSASSGIGITEGLVRIGDGEKHLRIDVDRTVAAVIGLVTSHRVGKTYFCRVSFSLLEMDDTTKPDPVDSPAEPLRFRMAISPGGAFSSS